MERLVAGVASPVLGPRTIEHLEGSLRTLEINMGQDILQRLDQIFPEPGGPAPEAYTWG
jgi:NDP-hexose C3-ketoreductase / dTDP-4-oxo-2-deoxy-alpha-D-pentos-2-ene 2,3-reductase